MTVAGGTGLCYALGVTVIRLLLFYQIGLPELRVYRLSNDCYQRSTSGLQPSWAVCHRCFRSP